MNNSSNPPVFTVIIPVHNAGCLVSRALRSVIDQQYKDIEIIVVDDASTDQTLWYVSRFSDSRIRVLERETPGFGGYAARNLGLSTASAQWIGFLDADDEWLPGHLSRVAKMILEHEQRIFAESWLNDNGEGSLTRSIGSRLLSEPRSLTFGQFLRLSKISNSLVHTSSVVVDRELLLQVGGFPEEYCRRGGDVATWLRLIHQEGALVVSPTVGAIYHRKDSTVTKQTVPEVQGNCVHNTVERLIHESINVTSTRLLKRFSNLHVSYGLVRRVASGQLSPRDLSFHYFMANPLRHVVLWFLGLLPGSIQISGWRLYKFLK